MCEKFLRKFSGKFLGKFPEKHKHFLVQMRWYRAKSNMFIAVKVMGIHENFGKVSGKISKIPKIPGRNFSGKFPGNSGRFSLLNPMIQRVNILFYYYKSKEHQEEFREKFPEKFHKFRKFVKIFPGKFPENSRKIGVFFRMECNATEQKLNFLFL